MRRVWSAIPAVVRIALPVALVLPVVGIGLAVWLNSPRNDNWTQLPSQLNCQIQAGPRPPESITVASVIVQHPRSGVLELVIRFVQPLPPSPTGTHASGFVGYVLTYSLANNGKKFVELGPEEDTDDLAIVSTLASNNSDASMRPDRDTNARKTAPDTIQINLDLRRLRIDNQPVDPVLTVDSQFNTPSTTTVKFAPQICHGS